MHARARRTHEAQHQHRHHSRTSAKKGPRLIRAISRVPNHLPHIHEVKRTTLSMAPELVACKHARKHAREGAFGFCLRLEGGGGAPVLVACLHDACERPKHHVGNYLLQLHLHKREQSCRRHSRLLRVQTGGGFVSLATTGGACRQRQRGTSNNNPKHKSHVQRMSRKKN